jgi:hypothetical protein
MQQQGLRKNTILNPIKIFFQTYMFLGLQQVKNNCGLQDDNQARLYTQQATGLLRDNANNDPQELSSLFGSFGGGMGQQQGGGIGNMVGGLLGGGGDNSGDNQNSSQEQQQKKKGGGLGDMLDL